MADVVSAEQFALDKTENPHPRMLTEALAARKAAETSVIAASFWGGFMAAMAAATGEPTEALHAWLDRNEDR